MANAKPIERKTVTDWSLFDQLNLTPTGIRCEGYKPYHGADMSCHSRVPLTAANMLNHLRNDHGGGFIVDLEQRPKGAKGWAGWQELQEAGVEIIDLISNFSQQTISLDLQALFATMQPHRDANKRMSPGKSVRMTLSLPKELLSE